MEEIVAEYIRVYSDKPTEEDLADASDVDDVDDDEADDETGPAAEA